MSTENARSALLIRYCWDWWGYSGSDYFVRSGPVKAMIDRIKGRCIDVTKAGARALDFAGLAPVSVVPVVSD